MKKQVHDAEDILNYKISELERMNTSYEEIEREEILLKWELKLKKREKELILREEEIERYPSPEEFWEELENLMMHEEDVRARYEREIEGLLGEISALQEHQS